MDHSHKDVALNDVSLTDADGKSVHLKELASEEGIVVGFLHGTYCPQCVQQLNRANRFAATLRSHRVSLAWVLADKPDNIATWRVAAVPAPEFELLPDSSPSVKRRLGFEEGEKDPAPTILYVDAGGTIRYAETPENPHAPVNLDALIAAIKEGRKAEESEKGQTPES